MSGGRSTVLGGVAWKLTAQAFAQGSRLVVAIILARLLAPDQFGIAAMVIVFTSLALVFGDLALGSALVQRRDIDEDDRSTAFWTSIGAGVLFTILGVACSPLIADFYGEPEVQPLVAAMSGGFLLLSLSQVQESLLLREMQFRSLELRVMVGVAAGGVVGIVVAATGGGAWAIVAQQLTYAACSAAILWVASPWRPTRRWSRPALRRLLSFSGYLFGHRLLYFTHRNIDNLLIGKFLGPASLGYYAIAYNVMLSPLSRVAAPIQDVLFPAFSRIQEDTRRIAAGWIRATRAVAAFSIPALIGLMVVAPEFIRVVLGPKWSEAVPVLQILAWVGLLQSLQALDTGILEARGRTKTIFWFTVVYFAMHLTAFVIGLQWGIVGVAAGYAVTTTLVEPVYCRLTAGALDIGAMRFWRALSGVAQAAAVMLAVLLVLRFAVLPGDLSDLATLVILVAAGVATYLPVLAWRAPEVVADAREVLGRARSGLRAARAGGAPAVAEPLPPSAT